jgi:hypothetical protein
MTFTIAAHHDTQRIAIRLHQFRTTALASPLSICLPAASIIMTYGVLGFPRRDDA